MENHPIPQDVTGFQFKLVGNMTLKQFGYVGAGVIMCLVFFYAPINFLIKFPLFMFSAAAGIGLAFIPVEGRPMDLMLSNFVKALISPNQYLYHKTGGSLSFAELNLQPVVAPTAQQQAQKLAHRDIMSTYSSHPEKEELLREYLSDVANVPQTSVDEKEAKYLSMFGSALPATGNAPAPQPQYAPEPAVMPAPRITAQPYVPPTQPLPAPAFQYPVQPTQQPPVIARPVPVQPFMQPIAQPIRPPAPMPQPAPIAPVQFQQPQPQLPPQPTMPIVQPAIPVAAPVMPPPPPPAPAPVAPSTPVTITQHAGPGVPTMPEFPNLVSGVVKDSRGNVLSGILIEIKNKSGESVRAFKTNALGQFASATQLTNGNYTIEFEDPKSQHTFAKAPIEANGSIISPLEVISIDAREQLRQQLFG